MVRHIPSLTLSRVAILICFILYWPMRNALSDDTQQTNQDPVSRLEQLIIKQSDEIRALKQRLDQQSERIKQLEQREAVSFQPRQDGATPSGHPRAASYSLSGTDGAAVGAQDPHRAGSGKEATPLPLSIRIGTADFTPGGFLDFTSIFRSTNVGSGIGTAFGAIPFSNTSQGRLSESRFSAQNSRLSLKATTKLSEQTNVTGYVEADFLGMQPPNGFVTSNSNSFRLRLYWAQLQWGKWEIMAGQSWSLMNPNRTGLSPMPSDIFYSQNMDTNYQVGLTWSRNPQFRLIYHANKNWTAGVSFENPEQFIGGTVALPSPFYDNQVDAGGNLSTPNWHPDVVAKVAFDARPANHGVHAEVAGLLRSFRVFNPTGNFYSKTTGGGVAVNTNVEIVRNLRLIVNTFYSDGGGRYIFGLGPDLIIRPDGSLSPVHAGSGIAGFEYQVTPVWMWYGYYGGAYFQRNVSIGPAGQPVGFGFAGSSNANRTVQEGTLGAIVTFWKKPEFGALQLITQYSYVTRSPWSVRAGTPRNAHAHMGYFNLRYVLP